MDEVDPPHSADFGGVIDEADVPLGGSVQLSDLDVPEAIQELRPNVRPDPVADSDPNFVILFVVSLRKRKKEKDVNTQRQKQRLSRNLAGSSFHLGRVAEVAHCFTDILHHRYVVLPAVVPELGC